MAPGKAYNVDAFCELLNLKQARVRRILGELVERRDIEALGANKNRTYILCPARSAGV